MTAYLRNVWRLRYFWMALVRSDLRSRYRRSMIGVGWSLLHPIAMTIVLCTVFSQLFQVDVATYGPFLLTGLVTWNFVVTVIGQGCQSFYQGESYIRQYPAPLAIYPLRTTLGAGVHFLMGLSVVLLLASGMQGFANLPALLSLVPTLAMLLVLGWSLAVCIGALNVMFQDTQHLTEVVLQILFYVTPIMYPTKLLEGRTLGRCLCLNPLAAYLELIREPILSGQIPGWDTWLVAFSGAGVAAAGAMLTLWRLERRMIFYL